MKAGKKVLLCEIVGENKYARHRGDSFPFVKGFLNGMGIYNEWVVVAVPHNTDARFRYNVTFKRQDERLLNDYIERNQITHLIMNESLCPSQMEGIKEKLDGRVMCFEDIPEIDRLDRYGFMKLRNWLDNGASSAETDALLEIQSVVPDYQKVMLNKLSMRVSPLVRILCGSSCGYANPVQKNPYYKDIPSEIIRSFNGCAFCFGGGSISECPESFPMDFVLRQINLSGRVGVEDGAVPEYWIEGNNIFKNMDGLFYRLVETSHPPSVFYFQPRIDDVCKNAPEIEKLLPVLRASGHALTFFSMGVENFSAVENERLNKGVTLQDFMRCHKFMMEWSTRYPNTFFFNKHGAFSFILFTPWTRMEDVEVNIKWFKYFEFDDVHLISKLQLFPDMPVTELARHDRLLGEKFPETIFDSGCMEAKFTEELPWRFQDERVGVFYDIISNFYAVNHPSSSKLYVRAIPHCITKFPFRNIRLLTLTRILLRLMQTIKSPLTVERLVMLLADVLKKNLRSQRGNMSPQTALR